MNKLTHPNSPTPKWPQQIAICLLFVILIGTGVVADIIPKNLGLPFSFGMDTNIPKPTENTIPKNHFIVKYSQEGFIPSTLTIPLNSTVEFRNENTIPLWVGSDPHPTHTDYSVFDARKDYEPGETFSFTFTQEGTFGFHNHEKSIHRGIIRVLAPGHTAPDISKTNESQRKLRDSFLAMLKPGDTDSIFIVIKAIESEPTLSVGCHDIAHDIGHRAYELYGFSGAMALTNPNATKYTSVQDICAGGYMHGILEEISLYQTDFTKNPGSVCASVPDEKAASCFHGVGHALMFSYKRDVESSLNACRTLGPKYEAPRCFEGVWMELFGGSADHSPTKTLGWDPQDPLAVCVSAQSDAKPACFLYSVFGYLTKHPNDFTGAITLCKAQNIRDLDKEFCIKGVGIRIVGHLQAHNLERSEPYAQGLTYYQKYAFYQGVLGYADFSGIPHDEIESVCPLLSEDMDICMSVVEELH